MLQGGIFCVELQDAHEGHILQTSTQYAYMAQISLAIQMSRLKWHCSRI